MLGVEVVASVCTPKAIVDDTITVIVKTIADLIWENTRTKIFTVTPPSAIAVQCIINGTGDGTGDGKPFGIISTQTMACGRKTLVNSIGYIAKTATFKTVGTLFTE